MEDFFEEGYLPKEKVQVLEEETETEKAVTMFQTMATIVNKKYWPSDEEIRKINSFMLVRYVSNDVYGIQMALYIDYFDKIPMEAQYRFFRHSLADKISYIKFPAKEKVNNAEELEVIQNHYKINQRLGMDYLKRLPQEEIDKLVNLYTDNGQIGRKTTKTTRRSYCHRLI